jgi:hypothetical protein
MEAASINTGNTGDNAGNTGNSTGMTPSPVGSSGNSSGSTTVTATPKLRLTFKLSEIRAASPVPLENSIPPTTTEASGVKERKRSKISKTTRSKKQQQQHLKDGESSSIPHQRGRKKDVVKVESNAESKNRLQFPEQIAFVREMQKFRTRHWRLQPCSLSLLHESLVIPGWCRDSSAGMKGSMTKFHSATFVCTFEGCHKIFDAKDKWRRHQNFHRKKALSSGSGGKTSSDGNTNPNNATGNNGSGLQIKFSMGAIKAASKASVDIIPNATVAVDMDDSKSNNTPTTATTATTVELTNDSLK